MKNNVLITGEDQLFEINNMDVNVPTVTCQFGEDKDNYLEITTSKLGGFIISINCQRQDNMVEMNMDFPEPEKLYKAHSAVYYPKSYNDIDVRNCGPFQLIFNTSELDIIFSSNVNVYKCYKNDRVEYYMDENSNLLYVRIRNLTIDEYNVLKVQKKNFSLEDEVKTNLKNIENNENIQVVGSSLIGSHAWGYSTQASDIDLRFVYVQDLTKYLSLNKNADNIAYDITEKWDVAGWDLKKFLQMVASQNSSAYEFLFSPVQLSENDYFNKLKLYSKQVFNKDKMVKQYLNLIDSRINELFNALENQELVKTKFLLYILRLICMINYINEKNEFPVCNYETLLSVNSNSHLVGMITDLINRKKNGNNFIQINQNILEYLKNQYINISSLNNKVDIRQEIDFIELDQLFVEGLRFYGKTLDNSMSSSKLNR